MNDFDELVKKLTNKPSEIKVLVRGKEKRIGGMARYTSDNLAPDEYIKVEFEDHSLMVVILADKQVFFTEKVLGRLDSMSDKMIGVEEVKYQAKVFRLDNGNDYQYCLQVYMGMPGKDIEGEGKFFDYVYETNGSLEVLSLGWQSNTGKRADVWVEEIGLDEVEVVG